MSKVDIQISSKCVSLLVELEEKEESYEDVLFKFLPVKVSYGTKDSYPTGYSFRTPDEIIDFIRRKRKEFKYSYNLYSGGEVDSMMARITCYRAGFDYKDCIRLKFISETQCRAFEKRIKHLFEEENFSPRKFH